MPRSGRDDVLSAITPQRAFCGCSGGRRGRGAGRNCSTALDLRRAWRDDPVLTRNPHGGNFVLKLSHLSRAEHEEAAKLLSRVQEDLAALTRIVRRAPFT